MAKKLKKSNGAYKGWKPFLLVFVALGFIGMIITEIRPIYYKYPVFVTVGAIAIIIASVLVCYMIRRKKSNDKPSDNLTGPHIAPMKEKAQVNQYACLEDEIAAKRAELADLDDAILLQSFGLYSPKYFFCDDRWI